MRAGNPPERHAGALEARSAAVMGVVLGLGFIVCGALLFFVGHRAADGKLAFNGRGGIRIPATLASEEAWMVGNRAAANALQAAGALPILGGVVMVAFQLAATALTIAVMATLIAVMGAVAAGAVQAHRAADALRDAR